MPSIPWSAFVPSVAFLALSFLALARGRRDPLASLFAALTCVLFAYSAFELMGLATADLRWERFAAGVGPIAVAVSVHFRVAFLGMRRRLRVPVLVMYAYFAAVAAACVLGLLVPALATFPRSTSYALMMLAGMIPTLGATLALLVQHHARVGAEERARTQLVFVAIVLGSAGAAVDLVAALVGRRVPEASPWGLLASSFLLAAVALRLPVYEGVGPLLFFNSVAVATIGIFAELGLARWLGAASAYFGMGTAVITVAVTVAARQMLASALRQRTRRQYHTSLGRLSTQMAHDVRNPLAAIRGAAQYLLVEEAEGRPNGGTTRYLELIVKQSDRIAAIIDRYQRIGKLEPSLVSTRINDLVEAVVTAQRAGIGSGFTIVTLLAEGLPTCRVDRELLAEALENLIRNAREAQGDAGNIEVTTSPGPRIAYGGVDVVAIRVRDEGPGMDARQRELALEEFYSTKSGGTGLGLPFVRKVAEAFGGRAVIEAEARRGTTVRIDLPAESAD